MHVGATDIAMVGDFDPLSVRDTECTSAQRSLNQFEQAINYRFASQNECRRALPHSEVPRTLCRIRAIEIGFKFQT